MLKKKADHRRGLLDTIQNPQRASLYSEGLFAPSGNDRRPFGESFTPVSETFLEAMSDNFVKNMGMTRSEADKQALFILRGMGQKSEKSQPEDIEEAEEAEVDEVDEVDGDMGFMDAVEVALNKGKRKGEKKAARKQKRQQRRAAKKASGKEPFPAGMEEVESPSASTDYAGMPADGSAVGYNEEPAEEVDMSDMMAAYRGEEVGLGIDPDEGAFDITAGAPKAIPVAEAVYTPEQAQKLFKVTHGTSFDPKSPADKKKMKEIEETLVEQGGLGDQSANQFALNIYRKYKYV